MLKLAVGYQDKEDILFSDVVKTYINSIEEVYFPFVNCASGRSMLGNNGGYYDYSVQERLISELTIIKNLGVKLNLLLNSNCNGADALSLAHQKKVVSILEYLQYHNCLPDIVTTCSPVTAQIVHNYNENIDVRASVNMRISTIKGVQYLENLFDSFCIFRDINRDLTALKKISSYLKERGKKLSILANSGCLRNCSMQTFHDNAVAHEQEILEKVNLPWAGETSSCHAFLSKIENRSAFLENTWIRPEDIDNYDGIVDTIKLATRMHELPSMVIDAYANRRYYGNLADLFEPGHGRTFAPFVIDNSKFPKDWFEKTTSCSKNCDSCNYCKAVAKQVFVNSEE